MAGSPPGPSLERVVAGVLGSASGGGRWVLKRAGAERRWSRFWLVLSPAAGDDEEAWHGQC